VVHGIKRKKERGEIEKEKQTRDTERWKRKVGEVGD